MGRARRFLSRLGERGNATIEFGLIGSAYLLMIVASFEVGYMLFLQTVLDNAARDAARLIRTGQAQSSANAQSTFQTLLCNEVGNLIPCGSIIYQAQAFSNWSSADSDFSASPTRNAQGNMVTSGFNAGSASEIVVLQVAYNYKFFTPWIGKLLGGSTDSAFLMSTVVFQNEPY